MTNSAYSDGYSDATLDAYSDALAQATPQPTTQPPVTPTPSTPTNGRTLIELGGQLDDLTEQVYDALRDYQTQHSPSLFLYGGMLVCLGVKKEIYKQKTVARPALIPVDSSYLCTVMASACHFVSDGKDKFPPKRVAEAILHWISRTDKQHYLPFEVLKGLVETPIIRQDGTICSTPGYDKKTGLYYVAPTGTSPIDIPETPTGEDLQQATGLILEVICDLPFDGDADKANMVALMLTPILRECIDECVPMALLDSPKWGTGKTLSAEVVAEIGTGEAAAVDDMPYSDEEMKKKITSMVAEGRTVYCL